MASSIKFSGIFRMVELAMKYLKNKYYELVIRIMLWRLKRKVRLYIAAKEKEKKFVA